MSRITRAPVVDGQTVSAIDLNNRFTDYSQPGALNAFNTRDAAFDLGQFASTRFMAPLMASTTIGYDDYKHGAYNTDTATAGVQVPRLVRDGAGNATPLSFGPTGWTIGTVTDVLRVYWDLSVRPRADAGTAPYRTGANLSFYSIGSGLLTDIYNGLAGWAFWLQWDITSNALANFVNVPGQGSFNNVAGPFVGENLTNTMATTSVQGFLENPTGMQGGSFNTRFTYNPGWQGISGDWHYNRPVGGPLTIYGLRVVFTGILTSWNTGGANFLVRDDVTSATGDCFLDHNGGALSAMLMRDR